MIVIGGVSIKNIANIMTSFRIVFAIMMILSTPFSIIFWICYFSGGMSDLMDGYIARKLNQQSNIGAKLDSIADGIFSIAIAVVVILNIPMAFWIWICVICIAILRIISYGIGFCKFHTFTSLHTYANKATGALIFVSPILYVLLGWNITVIILFAVAFVSAIEELLITIKSNELNRNSKSIF